MTEDYSFVLSVPVYAILHHLMVQTSIVGFALAENERNETLELLKPYSRPLPLQQHLLLLLLSSLRERQVGSCLMIYFVPVPADWMRTDGCAWLKPSHSVGK